jgi:hypothetical protein
MERSQLEELPDKALFLFIKKIENEVEIDLEESLFAKTCKSVGKLFNLKNLDYIDFNYIASVYNLNVPSVWESERLTVELNRPQVKLYAFQFYERRIETVETTYELYQESYSDKLVEDTIKIREYDGNLDWWDGKEVDRDYLDGETTDTGFVDGSIREVKK